MFLPSNDEIKKVGEYINNEEFSRLIVFSDTLMRFVDINSKRKFNWLYFNVLVYLIIGGGCLYASQLARLTLRSNYSMTRVIDNLERDNYVVRERVNKDRRIVGVKVTSNGLDFVLKTLKENDLIGRNIMLSLDDGEKKTFRDMMRIMRFTLIENSSKHPSAYVYFSRGIAYKNLGKNARAIADLETCIKLSQDKDLTSLAERELEVLQRS